MKYQQIIRQYLLVSPIEEKSEKKSLSIVLPTDYKKPENPHVLCRVEDISEQSSYYGQVAAGDTLIVERRMLNKIEFSGKSAYLVLENYIYGRLYNEADQANT